MRSFDGCHLRAFLCPAFLTKKACKRSLHTFAAAHGPFDENRPGMDAADLADTAMLGGTKTTRLPTRGLSPAETASHGRACSDLVVCMTVSVLAGVAVAIVAAMCGFGYGALVLRPIQRGQPDGRSVAGMPMEAR